MRTSFLILALFFASPLVAQTHRDTLWFDAINGNYIIQYIGEGDTLVTVVFEPATKVNPIIISKVERVTNEDTLIYFYEIKNGEESRQNLLSFEIEYKANVSDATTNRWYSRKVFDGKLENNRWLTFDAMRWRWSGDQGLQPTWRKDGFALKSKSVPGIVNAYFQGLAKEYGTPDGGPFSDVHLEVLKLMDFPRNYVIRKTVGPVLPLEPFVPLAFLDTLMSYKHQAFALGWIKNQGIVTSLDQKLDNAKAQLQRNNKTAARNMLHAFINEVEALNKGGGPQGGGQITSEAYALLKFNAEYLISKL